jgi:hypothetical protein
MDRHHVTIEPGEFAEGAPRLGVWADRLDAFIAALEAIDADDPFDYCADAWEIWQSAADTDPPPASDPASLVVLGALTALAHAMTSATLDYYRTADVRDRMTVSAVYASLQQCLGTLRRECRRWLHDGAPGPDEVAVRSAALVVSLQSSGVRPKVHTGIMFDKVCALTDAENKRYREAYHRLRTMLGRESLQHLTTESDVLCDVVTEIVLDLRATHGSTFDEAITKERRAKIGAALMSVTAALYDHRDQTISTATRMFGYDSAQAKAVRALFDGLTQSSFEYRWLNQLHQWLQAGLHDAVRYQFTGRRLGEPEVDVHLDRHHMTTCAGHPNRRWPTDQLATMTRDPSVLDMIKAVRPKVVALQDQLDKVMYPDIAEDVAAVKELLSRFGGQKGLDAVQAAPGSIHEPWTPPHLSPRVLSYVRSFEEPRSA